MRRKGSFRLVLMVVSIFLLSNIFNFIASEARSSIDTSYDPFYLIGDNETLIAHYHIQGDEELIQFVDAYGTGGSGTSVDPFVVMGLYVPVDAGEQCGLLIENTTLHISFDDLEIEEGSYYSMVISNCSNNFFISLTTHDLLIKSSSNITVIDISLISGGYIYDSKGIDIRENTAYLYFAFYDSQDIRIRKNNCTLSSTGFTFTNCINVDIENNTFKSTRYYLLSTTICNMILVRNNTFLGDKNGLYLSGDSSSVLRIYGNIFRSYNDACIWINYVNCHIYDNYFEENRNGLHINVNSNCSITGNIFWYNYYSSLDFYGDWVPHSNHTINNNTFYRNRGSGNYYDPSFRQIPDTIEQAGYDQYNFDGNFWYDWRKNDEDEDGIIDEPYILGPNGTYEMDRYPLARSPHHADPPEIIKIEQEGGGIRIHWTPASYRFLPILKYSIYIQYYWEDKFGSLNKHYYETTYFHPISGYEGPLSYYVKSYNNFSVSDPSNIAEILITGDIPELSIQSPRDGSYVNDLGHSLRLHLNDNESYYNLQKEIKLDDFAWEEFEYHPSRISDVFFKFSIEPEDGEHTISVRVRDPGGNIVERSTTFILYRSRPVINFTSPEPGEYSIEKEVEVTWEIISETIKSIHFRLEDGYNGLTGWIELPNLEQRSMKLHINKTTTFHLMVEDLAGNVKYAYKNLEYDDSAPILNIEPIYYSGNLSYDVHFISYDHESRIENDFFSWVSGPWVETPDSARWEWIVNEGEFAILTGFELQDLTEGIYRFQIRSVNYAGLSTTLQSELIVDLSPPVFANITPISGCYYNRELTLATWDVYDNLTGVKSVYMEFNGESMVEIDQDVKYFELPYLNQYEYKLNITAINMLGLQEKIEVIFYMDYKKPTINWRYPIGEVEEWNGTIHVVFSEEILPSSFSIYIDDVDNTMFGEQFWLSDTEMVFVPTYLPMDNVDHSIKVTGTDKSGNEINDYKWFFINVSSTGTVTGRIIDEDGKPIKGVAIYIDDQVFFLDDNASFLIPLCDGQHWIEVRKEGFSNLRMDFNISNGGDKNLGDLELRYEEVGSTLNPINIIIATVLLFVLITALTFFIYRRRRYFNEFNIPLSVNPKVRAVRKSIREVDPDREGNFYDFLSIDQGANVKEIRLAYRKKAVLYHPDRLSGASSKKREQAQEKMKRLNMIRDILTEPMTRSIYDREINGG